MSVTDGRQSRRVAKRRVGERKVPEQTLKTDASERIPAAERRDAMFAMIALGLTFLATCTAFVVLAAGEILG